MSKENQTTIPANNPYYPTLKYIRPTGDACFIPPWILEQVEEVIDSLALYFRQFHSFRQYIYTDGRHLEALKKRFKIGEGDILD